MQQKTVRHCLGSAMLAIVAVWLTACDSGASANANANTDAGSTATSSAASTPATPPLEVRHVDANGAQKLLADQKDVVILDIRTPREFASGHLAGATNIDFNTRGFSTEIAKLDRNATYLVHCAVGGRSTKSLSTFKELGFRSVIHLDGGLNAWRDAGKSVVK